MRSFVIAAVMTALVAGFGFALAPAPGSPASASSGAHAGVPVDGVDGLDATEGANTAASPAEPRAGAAPEPGKRTFYQWVDERGSVRFARSLDEVPAEWRERAGQVEVDASAYQPKSPRPGQAQRRAYAQVEATEARPRFHDVTVYTAPWCGWCRKTLAWLDERDVDYVNKDIEADEDHAEELEEKSGGRSIPFVEIDGTQIRGFNPREMAALLE